MNRINIEDKRLPKKKKHCGEIGDTGPPWSATSITATASKVIGDSHPRRRKSACAHAPVAES
jgi:hypothetical protein